MEESCLNCGVDIDDTNTEGNCNYCGLDGCDMCIEDHEDDCDENPENMDED